MPEEVVRALPHLNPSTVRTHIVSRCCVNAPANHAHRLGYFRRVRRGEYELLPKHLPPARAAFDFRLVATRGSHAKLARERPDGHREVLTVPLHSALAPGTVVAIYRQACRFVSESDLRPFFYTD